MKSGAFTFGPYTLDLTRGCLRAASGGEIKLRPKCFELLRYLVENHDRLVRKDELAQAVWPNVIVTDDSLAQCISDLRNALNDVERRIIKTVTGQGYLFAAPVSISAIEGTNHSPVFASPRLSIVVLPFANLSGDPDQEYFADGVTDDLTTDLSRISGSFVIARSTAFTFKGRPVDVKQIGRELGVRYVLEGSVQRAGDQVRMNVQLIDAEGGAHVWADRFETNRSNLAEAQREITGRIAHALNLELVKDVGRRIEQERPVDLDVQDLIMRGWYWWYRTRSTIAMQEAQRAFERALEIDPRSVDARIGIATVLLVNSIGNFAPRSNSSFERDSARAEQLLLEAIESDPSRPMAILRWGGFVGCRTACRNRRSNMRSRSHLALMTITRMDSLVGRCCSLANPVTRSSSAKRPCG
jgi:TolB-like protein